MSSIEADFNNGDMADGPLYVFGYSQSSVVMGMAEQQLATYDSGAITPQDLNFVMVGDSASAEGGFLNTFLDEFPASWQQSIVDLFKAFGADEVLGQVTPDNYFPTEVYRCPETAGRTTTWASTTPACSPTILSTLA